MGRLRVHAQMEVKRPVRPDGRGLFNGPADSQ
jgi:hypothetical protein